MSTRPMVNPDSENLTAYPRGKAVPTNTIIVKRPALRELGNKLGTQPFSKGALKPGIKPLAPPQHVPKKITVAVKPNPKPLNEKKDDQKPKLTNKVADIIQTTTSTDKEAESHSTEQLEILDPDASSKNDPNMVTEYLSDIFNYLRKMEMQYAIKEKYLEGHPTTPHMRQILVNWIVEVHGSCKFYLETLHLCVSLIDRYLQACKDDGRETLQLVGVSALLLAGKYEEIYLPDLDDFVYFCDETFSKRQILQMERKILKTLDFNLSNPLSIHFLRRYSKVAGVQMNQHILAKYLLELALCDYSMAHISPSQQAAAACCLAIGIIDEVPNLKKVWTPTLVHYSTYSFMEIWPIMTSMAHLIVKVKTSKQRAVFTKYSSSTYAKISLNAKLQGAVVKRLVARLK